MLLYEVLMSSYEDVLLLLFPIKFLFSGQMLSSASLLYCDFMVFY